MWLRNIVCRHTSLIFFVVQRSLVCVFLYQEAAALKPSSLAKGYLACCCPCLTETENRVYGWTTQKHHSALLEPETRSDDGIERFYLLVDPAARVSVVDEDADDVHVSPPGGEVQRKASFAVRQVCGRLKLQQLYYHIPERDRTMNIQINVRYKLYERWSRAVC